MCELIAMIFYSLYIEHYNNINRFLPSLFLKHCGELTSLLSILSSTSKPGSNFWFLLVSLETNIWFWRR